MSEKEQERTIGDFLDLLIALLGEESALEISKCPDGNKVVLFIQGKDYKLQDIVSRMLVEGLRERLYEKIFN